MKYSFKVQGVDCAHCWSKIEAKLIQDDMFEKVTMNFIQQSVEVITREVDVQKIRNHIKRIAETVEEQVEVTFKQELNPTYYTSKDYRIWGRILGSLTLLLIGSCFNLESLLFAAYGVIGYDVLFKAFRNCRKGKLFDEHFLMSMATIAAFVIKEYPEAVAVMLFYQVGEYFQSRAMGQSRRAITALMAIKSEFARVRRGDEWIKVDPKVVKVGDVLQIRAGEKMPLDGVITKGSTTLDTAAMTGESLPVYKTIGDHLMSGTINLEQMIEMEVTHTLENSTVSRVLELIEGATSRKTKAEDFITQFAAIYTPIVVGLAILFAIVPSFITGNWSYWIYTSITFLVISCPCALVISIPLSFYGGIGSASKEGVLIKGSNYLEMLGKVDTIVMDKTGTLTKGNFEVTHIIPAVGVSEKSVLEKAIQLERYSNHPIAKAITKYGMDKIEEMMEDVLGYREKPGYGLSGVIEGKHYDVGNHLLMEEKNIAYNVPKAIGTVVYVAIEGVYQGCIVVADTIKEDSQLAIKQLKDRGIQEIIMLTGDKQEVAENVGKAVGITKMYAELLPQDKVAKVQQLIAMGRKVAFIGDGINDAPVLALSDVGIAMGGMGSDAAVEASDIVLMTDALTQIPKAIDCAKRTKQIVMQNIIFALGIKGLVMLMGVAGVANMWLAIFADVGVSVLAILNAMRTLRPKKHAN